jgi:hypothetical protein
MAPWCIWSVWCIDWDVTCLNPNPGQQKLHAPMGSGTRSVQMRTIIPFPMGSSDYKLQPPTPWLLVCRLYSKRHPKVQKGLCTLVCRLLYKQHAFFHGAISVNLSDREKVGHLCAGCLRSPGSWDLGKSGKEQVISSHWQQNTGTVNSCMSPSLTW